MAYTATTVHGSFAEVFQEDRVIQLDPDRALSAWFPTRPLQLIDLSASDFGVHNGAAHVLPTLEDKALTRRWARAIVEQFGDRPGLPGPLRGAARAAPVRGAARPGTPLSSPR